MIQVASLKHRQPPKRDQGPRHHHDDVPVYHALTIPWLSIHVSVRKKTHDSSGDTPVILGLHHPSSVLLVTPLVKPVLVALKPEKKSKEMKTYIQKFKQFLENRGYPNSWGSTGRRPWRPTPRYSSLRSRFTTVLAKAPPKISKIEGCHVSW